MSNDSKPSTLGHFEQLVLSAVLALNGTEPYSLNVAEKISQFQGKEANLGSVYVTLDRLKRKGFVRVELSEPRPERGGKPRASYFMTPAGEVALSESLRASVRAYVATESFWERFWEAFKKLRPRRV